jgi:hypothetical protein
MLFIAAIAVVGLVWLYIHVVSQPEQKWTDCYRRGLSRPQWADEFPCREASEFVSWAGITPLVWARDVQPSIKLVAAALRMQPALAQFNIITSTDDSALTAALNVYYVHLLAGVPMTPVEACAHALMVYYGGEDVVKDPDGAALRLVGTGIAFADSPPPALIRYLAALEAHFEVHLLPLELEPRQPPPAARPTLSEERRKAE